MELKPWIEKVRNKNAVFLYKRGLSYSLKDYSLKDKVFSLGTTAKNEFQWKNILVDYCLS